MHLNKQSTVHHVNACWYCGLTIYTVGKMPYLFIYALLAERINSSIHNLFGKTVQIFFSQTSS